MSFYQGFVDINLGIGTLIIGLASVIIGELIIPSDRISLKCLSCVLGAIIYRFIIGFVISYDIGFRPSDLNILTSVLMVLLIVVSKRRAKDVCY